MKKLFFAAAMLIGFLSFKTADAQLHLSIGVNIGDQPDWGPVGYDHVDYYYMPDLDVYYDVPHHQYVYYENREWVRNDYLPSRYHFDKYNTYKVVVNESRPWAHQDRIRSRYAGYRGHGGQAIIRDSPDEHYRNHWREGDDHRDHGDHGDRDHRDRDHKDHGRGDH